MRIRICKHVLNKIHLINLTDVVQLSWDKVHHRLTKSLMDVIKVASSRRRNVILDQVKNMYAKIKGPRDCAVHGFGGKLLTTALRIRIRRILWFWASRIRIR
jgi:hypothetical protein